MRHAACTPPSSISGNARRQLYPGDRALSYRLAQGLGRRTTSISRNAARPRASPWLMVHGGPGGGCNPGDAPLSTIPRATASCCSTSAAAGARPRMRRSRRTPPGTSSPTWSGCARISASRPGSFAAAPGARRCRWPTPKPIRSASPSSFCAASSSCGRPSSTGSTRRAAAGYSPTPSKATPPRSPPPNAADMIEAYHRRLTSGTSRNAIAAARAWSVWEGTTLSLFHDQERVQRFAQRKLCARLRPHRMPLLHQQGLLQER